MIYGRMPMGTVSYMGGVPAVYEQFCWSWGQFIQYNEEFLCDNKKYIHYDRATFSDHAPARNSLVQKALGDWLFMLDTDHVFEPDILHRLLTSMTEADIDVITGMYQFKKKPYSPVVYGKNVQGNTQALIFWSEEAKLFRIEAAGAGCLLVKRKVFDRIRNELGKEPFDRIEGYSEDHSFFKRLKELDIKAFCDPRVECNHVVVQPICLDDFKKYQPKNIDKNTLTLMEVEGFQ